MTNHLYPDSPPFDTDAVEALTFYQRSIAIVIDDDDPDPNTIKKLLLSCSLGSWKLTKNAAEQWVIDGRPVGESVAREIDMLIAFEASSATDLRDLQGPEAAARYQ